MRRERFINYAYTLKHIAKKVNICQKIKRQENRDNFYIIVIIQHGSSLFLAFILKI